MRDICEIAGRVLSVAGYTHSFILFTNLGFYRKLQILRVVDFE